MGKSWKITMDKQLIMGYSISDKAIAGSIVLSQTSGLAF
jgi:hypothetical protein